jgi:hypothetical protein
LEGLSRETKHGAVDERAKGWAVRCGRDLRDCVTGLQHGVLALHRALTFEKKHGLALHDLPCPHVIDAFRRTAFPAATEPDCREELHSRHLPRNAPVVGGLCEP